MSRSSIVGGMMLVAAFIGTGLQATGQAVLEYQLKAAYLYNFAKFVTWPGNEGGGLFTICVLGRDPFGQILDDTVRGKSVRGQAIVLRRISRSEEPRGCQIVFADYGEQYCRDVPVHSDWDGILLVGEGDAFARCGGMIALTLKDGRVQFDINVQAVSRAHLGVSSKLLQVASIVPGAKVK